MRKIYDGPYEYTPRGGAASTCHLTVWKAAGGIAAIARRPAGDPYFARRATELADQVWQRFGAPARFSWIEEAAPGETGTGGFRLVEFARRADGRLCRPRRRAIARQAVAALVAQDYTQEWPAAWQSLPPQGLHLECLACGCHLPIAAILDNLRYCAACRAAGRAPRERQGPPAPEELLQAREEFRQRAGAHERYLGLTPGQRHALFRALAGPRSLWEFRPEELRALAAQLEQFDSAAEVEEFLAVRLAEDAAG